METATIIVIFVSSLLLGITTYSIYTSFGPASDIAAHRAQLGRQDPGLFPAGDVQALASRLSEFVSHEEFFTQLRSHQLAVAATLTSPAQERDELVRLVRRLAEFLPKESS